MPGGSTERMCPGIARCTGLICTLKLAYVPENKSTSLALPCGCNPDWIKRKIVSGTLSRYWHYVALAVRTHDRFIVNLLAAEGAFLAEAYHEHHNEADWPQKETDQEPDSSCAAPGTSRCANYAANNGDDYGYD